MKWLVWGWDHKAWRPSVSVFFTAMTNTHFLCLIAPTRVFWVNSARQREHILFTEHPDLESYYNTNRTHNIFFYIFFLYLFFFIIVFVFVFGFVFAFVFLFSFVNLARQSQHILFTEQPSLENYYNTNKTHNYSHK